MKLSKFHIGEKINEVLYQKGISKAQFARLLEIKPQSVDYLIKRKSIDTDMMYKISEILDYDFSELFRLNQTNCNQINFDINTEKTKILVELSVNKEDIYKLNIRDKVLHLFDIQR